MRRNAYLFLLLVILFSSCGQKPSLEKEVMAIHDEVMPKMGDIHAAKKVLRAFITDSANDSLNSIALSLISDLDNADEGMMEWMHNWKVPAQDPEKTAYLKDEKEKINKVKNDMLTSIKDAEAFINDHK